MQQCPRQQLFNDYARQLMRRYPQLKQEISSRLGRVNDQWKEVMSGFVLPPGVGHRDTRTMLFGIFWHFSTAAYFLEHSFFWRRLMYPGSFEL